MTWVVVVADKVDEGGLTLLGETPDVSVVKAIKNPAKLKESLPRAHALLVRSETKVTPDILAQAPALKVIGRAGIGVDNINVEEATRRGIAVFNAPGGNTVSAAEHTVGLLLALVRRIPFADASMRRGEWDRPRFQGTELRGKTLGVVGLGRIGAHVATLARAFGMQVIAYDPYVTEARAHELHVDLASLDELLPRVDVVTLHLPLTKETKALIDRRRIELMKPSAVLLNCARGGLVDEAALLAALEAGRLAGAALDVFSGEPLPADSPLRKAERLILTPHLAASTAEAQELVGLEICRVIKDALITGNLAGAVNLPGVSGGALGRLAPLLELARRLGRLAAALSPGRVGQVEVHYGGAHHESQRVVQLAAIEGLLGAMGVGPANLINAAVLAEGRGIALGGRVGAPEPGFETTIEVAVHSGSAATKVVGALAGEEGHIVRINGFAIDIPPDGHVLVLKNRDVPGVIGRVGTVLGDAKVNIAAYHLSRRTQRGQEALSAVAVDHPPPAEVLERLGQLQDVLDVRLANLNGAA
jgi:D-3-phosphoglycerate dehydrogenase